MSAGVTSIVDVVAVVAVVVVAAAFLASRFIDRQKPGGGEVVVGAALQKGLQRARRRRS